MKRKGSIGSVPHLAPAAIHASISLASAAGNGFFGGISPAAIRFHNSLSAALPGTTAAFAPATTPCLRKIEIAFRFRPGVTTEAAGGQERRDLLVEIRRRGERPARTDQHGENGADPNHAAPRAGEICGSLDMILQSADVRCLFVKIGPAWALGFLHECTS